MLHQNQLQANMTKKGVEPLLVSTPLWALFLNKRD